MIMTSSQSADALLDDLEARGLKLRGRAPSDYQSIDNLLKILAERGLEIGDERVATHYLNTIGHHRLTAFYPSFYENEKKFDGAIPTSLEDVFHLYSFDRRLRLLLMGPLEKIEVALRALIIREMGEYLRKNGRTDIVIDLFDKDFYDLPGKRIPGQVVTTNEQNFQRAQDNCRDGARAHWNALYPSAVKRNFQLTRDDWQKAFPTYYKTLPAWTVLQLASFGPLTHIYATLKPEIAIAVSNELRMPWKVLRTSLFALKELRNSCAHHEPIWNWNAGERTVELSFPKRHRETAGVSDKNERRLYPYCALIHILLSFLSNGQSTWHRRLKKLVNEFNTIYGASMGFPEDWQTMPFWCVSDVARTPGFTQLRDRVRLQTRAP